VSFFFGAGALAIISIFDIIRQFGKIDWFQYMISPTVLADIVIIISGMTYFAGRIVMESASHVHQMKAKCWENRILRREIKSLRKFGITVTILPAIKKAYFLGFMFIVSKLAGTLLVSVQKRMKYSGF